jgi:hypothetical protein
MKTIFAMRQHIINHPISDCNAMAQTNEHGRIIAAAAKAALLPLGCKRKGQSRLWYSDQRFWVITVEFQPSGWSKGCYLNVGVKWLWNLGRGLDFSDRPVDFIPLPKRGAVYAANRGHGRARVARSADNERTVQIVCSNP